MQAAASYRQILSGQFDVVPPHSVAAEEGVIGSGLLDAATFAELRSIVDAAHFFVPEHAAIWQVMCAIVDGGDPLDSISLVAELERRDCMDHLGRIGTIARLLACVPDFRHGPAYARILKDCALRRRGIEISNRIVMAMYSPPPSKSAADLVAYAAREFTQLAEEAR